MKTLDVLEKLKQENKLTTQQYKTYRGQVMSGAESGCIVGMQRKHLITDEQAQELLENMKLAYTE